MPDLGLSVIMYRTLLGLGGLQLNDHDNYYVGPQLLGGQVQWNRTQVSSPFVDGAVTTFRSRQVVTDTLSVEVLGADQAQLRANLDQLVTAASQDFWSLAIRYDGQLYWYNCEAADYTISWTGPRVIAGQIEVQLSFPRQPVARTGIA